METTRIRLLLKTIAQESATLRLLSYDTERLKKQFGLSETELDALRSVDLLRASQLSGRKSPILPDALVPGSHVTGIDATSIIGYPMQAGAQLVNMYDGLQTLTILPAVSNGHHSEIHLIEDHE